jgi:hypothetical protein
MQEQSEDAPDLADDDQMLAEMLNSVEDDEAVMESISEAEAWTAAAKEWRKAVVDWAACAARKYDLETDRIGTLADIVFRPAKGARLARGGSR